ncbi:MAG: HAD family hydrolase [Syntrophaceticus sp.]|nr:HAD family hydrolase [Syntrophaceticus sp.]MDD3314445.1 HAD family hydrolase [Syntrophaceticus sp.]MDD4783905.1 HAD family hydrolase [Syntrophaceticus sp.]HBG22672.1 HAD family hydrolase [Peptococcaceae bacterium]
MLEVILFDLDGTLVPMDLDYFTKSYMQALCTKFFDLIPPQKLVHEIWQGTYRIANDLDPGRTNKDVFWEYFLPKFSIDAEILISMFDDFYNQDFAQLKKTTKPNPDARSVIDTLLEKGYRVGIATNPIFPARAIEERLNWVGVADLPYSLVTTYEKMHYCKPHVEYYQEIVEMIDVCPERCLMVGNDVEEDLAARKLGMKTFLVEDCLLNTRNLNIKTDYRGSFAGLVEFIEELP